MTRGPYKLITKGMTEGERSAWFRGEGKKANAARKAGFKEDPYLRSMSGKAFGFMDGLCEHHGKKKRKPLYWSKFHGDECVPQWYRQAGFPA